MEDYILCCDWGTTSLRLRLVDIKKQEIVEQVRSSLGIAKVFHNWGMDMHTINVNRTDYYLSYLLNPIEELSLKTSLSIDNLPLIISGMASSSIGMKELPYSKVPFNLDGSTANADILEPSVNFENNVFLISGIQTTKDVMRGEEVQLIGMNSLLESLAVEDDILIILPGTHSKHALIRNNQIIDFETYITGELFALLTENGLLKEAVQASSISEGSPNWTHFIDGVIFSGDTSILQSLFKVRTNELFKKLSKNENYFFLSGLLIGYELRNLENKTYNSLILGCQNGLFEYYEKALEILNLSENVYLTMPHEIDNFTIQGQIKTYKKFSNRNRS